MQDRTSETQVIELDYPAVRVGKNLAGRFFDLFTFAIFGIILLIPTLFLIQGNKGYQSWISEQDEIRLESQLYKKNKEGKIVILGSYYDEEDELTFNEKSDAMEEALTFFFTDYVNEELSGEGKKTYLTYKLDLKNKDGEKLFSEEGKRVFPSSDYDSLYYSSYCSLVKNQATGYLNLKGEYLSLKKKTSLTYLIGIPLTFVLSYCVVYYIIPLCLNRGKQTLGMKMTKTALLGVDGFSCGAGRFTLRFLFKLFIILIGSFAALFIPLAVSITMVVLMKSHQSLSEYVTNTYLVSIEDRSVYRNLSEYRIANQAIEEETVCPHCGKNLDTGVMTVKDVHELHQNAHNCITANNDRKNSGLVFLVTGAILLIIGGLFLFLSFKYNTSRVKEFRPATIEFVVCCICLSISLFELILGTIRLIKSVRNIHFYQGVIRDTKIAR